MAAVDHVLVHQLHITIEPCAARRLTVGHSIGQVDTMGQHMVCTKHCNRLLLGLCQNYEVSTMEIDRDTDSYMIFTVNEILSKYKDAQLFLIIGSDMFLSFHKWYKYREIMKKCTLCVMSREDEDTVKALRSYAFSTLHIYMPSNEANGIIISPSSPLEISSTEIRQKISAGEDVSDVLTKEAYEFIKERGMYGYAKK